MRFLASASSLSLMFSGMPGSKTLMPTSSNSASGMCTVACWATTLGIGLVSLVTHPVSASAAASTVPATNLQFMTSPHSLFTSLRRFLVVVVFLPEPLLELRIRFFLGRLAQATRDDVVVVAAGLRTATAAAAGTDALATLVALVAALVRVAGVTVGRPRLARLL